MTEKTHMKIVGKRTGKFPPSLENADVLQKTMQQLRGVKGLCPRGVYRFKSFEEAHEWMIKMLARADNRGLGATLQKDESNS